jgi:CheY-like chemotaxis protein
LSVKQPDFRGRSDPASRTIALKTLLVLEDEWAVMKLLRYLLKQYRIIEATNAAQALQLFIERGRQVDLLLADLTLPTSSGVEVALLLRSEIPDLPVILTSGYPVSGWNDRDSSSLQRLGADRVAILEKPFRATVISNLVLDMVGPSRLEKVAVVQV